MAGGERNEYHFGRKVSLTSFGKGGKEGKAKWEKNSKATDSSFVFVKVYFLFAFAARIRYIACTTQIKRSTFTKNAPTNVVYIWFQHGPSCSLMRYLINIHALMKKK